MAFTYDASLTSDVDIVRFRLGDNKSEGYYLEDAEIDYWLANTDSLGEAMVKCIDYIIAQLAQPDFKLDWLTVSNREALKAWERTRTRIAQEEGVVLGAIPSASVSTPYRADSDQTDSTYDGS